MADNWSMLPFDILIEIALKLDCPEDIIYFAAVCHSWNGVYPIVMKEWLSRPRMPWLMLAENTKDNPNYLRKLYCPSSKRCYQLKLPQTFGARCWGSSCGWVVTLDRQLEMHLVNPLTRARIRLPPQSTKPKLIEEKYKEACDKRHGEDYFISKVHVVIDDNDDWIVFVLYRYGSNSCVAYARPGDQVWRSILTPIMSALDVVRWGTKILFLGNCNGFLGYCDINAIQNSQTVTANQYLSPSIELLNDEWTDLYLLESFGDLLMVFRYANDFEHDVDRKTIDFKVYKLNFDTICWEEVKDLGDVALFVGNNHSMSIRSSSTNNCKCNCIYFTDDVRQYFWYQLYGTGGHDMGIFSIKDMEFKTLYDGDDVLSDFCAPIWFMPMLGTRGGSIKEQQEF